MKTAILSGFVAVAMLVSATPAAALSCMESEPFDMSAAIANADAAGVGVVTEVRRTNETEWEDADLTITIDVIEVYKGRLSSTLVLERRTSVWGPYYEVGQELALLVTGGIVEDGANSLCGPFYWAEDMRAVGGEPTAPGWIGWLVRVLHRLLSAL